VAIERGRSVDDAFMAAEALRRLGFAHDPVLVNARYEFIRRIGWGGYGTVYEAHDRELNRRVAVKVLNLGERDVALREGRALAGLEHDNVVKIHEHGEGQDYRYIVMQLLDGPTLRVWCGDRRPAQRISKYAEAGAGLAAAHDKGLVHRDFKPANVLIGPKDQAVVVDFGLARHLDTLEGDLREHGRFAGTIAYAPPERLRGLAGDERSDQFSFCVALWECLSGVNPFGACDEATTLGDRGRALERGIQGKPRGPRRVIRALRRGLSLARSDHHDGFARAVFAAGAGRELVRLRRRHARELVEARRDGARSQRR
jgi:serine/threonine protein kinase